VLARQRQDRADLLLRAGEHDRFGRAAFEHVRGAVDAGEHVRLTNETPELVEQSGHNRRKALRPR
jgi:hypothetical protein